MVEPNMHVVGDKNLPKQSDVHKPIKYHDQWGLDILKRGI